MHCVCSRICACVEPIPPLADKIGQRHFRYIDIYILPDKIDRTDGS